MVKRLILSLVVLIFLLQIVVAIDTEIKVKTMPYHEVQLTTYKTDTPSFTAIEKFKEISDGYGDVVFMSSTSDSEFNILIYLKKDGESVLGPEQFLNKPSGTPISLEIAPAWFEFIETPGQKVEENVSLSGPQDTELVDEGTALKDNEDGSASTTGSSISDDKKGGIFTKNKLIFYAVGILALFIAGLFIEYEAIIHKVKGLVRRDTPQQTYQTQEY
ncbi:MAG: hypothetical protein ABIA78_02975 [archaeon]